MPEQKKDKYAYKKLQDPNFKGDPVEDSIQEGPFANRACTDIICCFIFIAFIGAMGFVAYFGLLRGDPYRLSCPFNSYAVQCGLKNYTMNTTATPYLYFPGTVTSILNLETITDSLCVSKCPNTTTEDLSLYTCFSNQNGTCKSLINGNPTNPLYGSSGFMGRFCIPYDKNSSATILTEVAKDVVGRIVSDIVTSWEVLCISIGSAFILCMIYLLILRCFAGVIIWATLIGIELGLAALGYFCWQKYVDALEGDSQKDTFYRLAIAVWCVAGLYLLILLCLSHKIAQAIRIIKEASRFVQEKPSVLLTPILGLVMAIAFIGYWAFVAVYIWSSGTFTYNKNPFASVQWDTLTQYSFWYHLFGLIWGECFIYAFLQFVIAATVVQWYFAKDKKYSVSIFASIFWGIRYHLGSLAFGSLLLAIVIFIQILFEYMRKKMMTVTDNENKFIQCLIKIIRCCLWCLNRFIRFLTSNAYVMIAISGKNFCLSCIKAFFLLLKNAFVFALVYVFGTLFIVIGELAVALGNGIAGYFLIRYYKDISSQLYSYMVPVIMVGIVGFLIAVVFMYVYELAIKSITQCFFCDNEIAERNKKAHKGRVGTLQGLMQKKKSQAK